MLVGIGDMTKASLQQKQDVCNNPESFLMFALAAYIYQNPPDGADAILFLDAGLPQIAATAIAKARW
jgi:predicted metal-dependent HD superfamily phosphohydrolase